MALFPATFHYTADAGKITKGDNPLIFPLVKGNYFLPFQMRL